MAGNRRGLHAYTVQEAQGASMGQAGSILVKTSTNPCTNAIGDFVAITMITDCTFDASAGLVAEDAQKYINTETAAHDLASADGSLGEGGQVVDSVVFTSGLTIYGRWTEIDVSVGSCVAYIG